jgi:hypothetical protein
MEDDRMSDVDTGATPILEFLAVRAPEPVADASMRRHYIRDGDFLRMPPLTHVPPPPSVEDYSAIGAIVVEHVFGQGSEDPMGALIEELLELVGPAEMPVNGNGGNGSGGGSTGGSGTGTATAVARELRLEELERHAVILRNGAYYVLPSTLHDVGAPLAAGIAAFLAFPAEQATRDRAIAALRTAFGNDLSAVVFAPDGRSHADEYVATVRALFEVLYLLYVLRRQASIDLGEIITALRVLHLLEACAIDEVVARSTVKTPAPRDAAILTLLVTRYPSLGTWDRTGPAPGFPLVANRADLSAYLAARPVVHPIFARLFAFTAPFNDIKPLGIGDFKVVKQRLIEYLPGEICDIHNVMKGETKDRVHRRLEKTEETFSFSSSFEDETSRDTQSTDRFELKREVENTLKTDLNVNATANVRYDNKVVVATVGAGFAYNRSDGTVDKTAQNFSHEVVSKAVSRVQTRTTEQRSVTKLSETEETNKHAFTAPTDHTSGIYRWLDKRYEAQLFNYGKRMMFEFVLPEPAALFVASRLRAYEAQLNYPDKPKDPEYVEVEMPVANAGEITAAKFDELRATYDLSAFTYPPQTRTITFVDSLSGASLLHESGIDGSDKWYSKALKCSFPGATGYELSKLFVTGQIEFDDHHVPPDSEADRNLLRVEIDGAPVMDYENNLINVNVGNRAEFPLAAPFLFVHDEVDVVLNFQDAELYHLMISGELTLGEAALKDWQAKVYTAIHKVEKARTDERNRDIRLKYNTDLSTYTNAISELESAVLNDLLQGTSEAANEEVIRTELRRQVLVLITKELGVDPSDDFLSSWETMGSRTVSHLVTRLKIDEKAGDTNVAWTTEGVDTKYPVPDVAATRRKGEHVQFLEQAFDWDNLAFLFYPYFWATPPKWMELLARSSDTDPTMTAFLRAGAVRVLVAVSPAYDDAVLHYLATREPWEGGPSPVIGDPLYLPLHEELRQQQDDLYGAVADGEPWEFTVPTTLVYLHSSTTPLPDLVAEREARQTPEDG